MLTIIAYVLVIPLSPFVSTAGMIISGFPVALALAWTSMGVRTKVAGFLGGICGIVAAVAFGYFVFHWLVGPYAYTLGPFLATIMPLGLQNANVFALARRVRVARHEMLATFETSRPEAVPALAEESKSSHASMAIGGLFGIALVCLWFFTR